jgi:hypothetical protein
VRSWIDQPPSHLNGPQAISPERWRDDPRRDLLELPKGWMDRRGTHWSALLTMNFTSRRRPPWRERWILSDGSPPDFDRREEAARFNNRAEAWVVPISSRNKTSSRRRESNPRPELYKSPALPLSYSGAYWPTHRCLVCNQPSFLMIPGSSTHAYRSLPRDRTVTRQLLYP